MFQETRHSDDSSQNASKKGRAYIPYVPNFLLKLLDKTGKANIGKWRDLPYAGKTMVKDDLVIAKEDDKGNDEEDKSSESGKPPPKKNRRIAQNESLLNSHPLRRNMVWVNDIAKKHNGNQNMESLQRWVLFGYCQPWEQYLSPFDV